MQVISTVLEWLSIRLLRSGPVPKHVCFVADGARRFGKKYDIPVQENHEIGYVHLLENFL